MGNPQRGTALTARIQVVPPADASTTTELELAWTRSAETPEPAVALTLDLDVSVLTAWYAPDRCATARVYLDGVDVTDLVVGEIEVEQRLDEVLVAASFEILTSRASYFGIDSLVNREAQCRIDFLAGADPQHLETVTVIEGYVEGVENTGSYIPKARLTVAGNSAAWADKQVCAMEFAFSGKRRGQIIREALDRAEIPYVNTDLDNLGAIQEKPVDYQGLTIKDLLDRFCVVERWRYRVTPAGELEILDEAKLLQQTPMFNFEDGSGTDVANYYAISQEETPRRPRSVGLLSGTQIAQKLEDPAASGTVETESFDTDADGNPVKLVTRSTLYGGVEIARTVEEWAYFALDGVTVGHPNLQKQRETRVEWTYQPEDFPNGERRLTTQLNFRVTRVYEWAGIRASPDHPTASYLWESGDRYTTASAQWMLVSMIVEDYDYDSTGCTVKNSTVVEWGYYAPLADPVLGTTYIYEDQTYRDGYAYEFQVVRNVRTLWQDYRQYDGTLYYSEAETLWAQTGWGGTSYEDQPVESYRAAASLRRVWKQDVSGTSYTLTTTETRPVGITSLSTTKVETFDGVVPAPFSGSDTVAKLEQEVILEPYDFSSGRYGRREWSETIEIAQSRAELQQAALNAFRRDTVVKETGTCSDIPYLAAGDHVTVRDLARNLDGKDAYITTLTRRLNIVSGKLDLTWIAEIPTV